MERGTSALLVTDVVDSTVGCGDPENGFAWLRCGGCDHHRIVPFSCKTRGFCPSCGGRRMAERAARWVDGLLPRTAVRQWVITVPWSRRWLLARKPDLLKGVLRLAMDEVFGWYEQHARRSGRQDARCGAIAVTQRFGSALNLNVHWHVLVPDGYFAKDPKTGRVRFYQVGAPTDRDVENIVIRIAERVERWLATQGYGTDEEAARAEDVEDADDALAVIQAASIQGQLALGQRAGRRARRNQTIAGRTFAFPPRCAGCDGYTVHAGVAIGWSVTRPGTARVWSSCAVMWPVRRCLSRDSPNGRMARWS
jgi:hypothetical protein